MKWFKHSGTASRDARIAKLMTEFGIAGYGLYFYCIELIASKTDADDLTFELEHDAELIASWTQMDTLQVEKIMHRCIDLGLFDMADNGHLTCFKLIKWIDRKLVGEKIYGEMVGKIGENPRKSPKIPAVVGENPLLLDKNRIEKNREYGSEAAKPQPTPRFQKPTLEEIQEYCLERKNLVDPGRFLDFYESKGWLVGKVKMRDWRAAVRTWERNEFSSKTEPSAAPPIDYDARERERVEARVQELIASGRFTEAEARANPWHPKQLEVVL